MDVLHKTLEKTLENIFPLFLAGFIEKKLNTKGIKLSVDDFRQLQKHIRRLDIDVRHSQNWRWLKKKGYEFEFTDEIAEEIEKQFTEFLTNRLDGIGRKLIEELSEQTLKQLKRNWPVESRNQQRDLTSFRRRLEQRWKNPFERLRMFLTIARELGANINEELRRRKTINQPHLVNVLTRSHARACQVTEEIICLLASGFADGAMARWRTLHEISVTALFISKHGDELAELYIIHGAVESRKAAKQYERYREKLGEKRLSKRESTKLDILYNAAVKKFGKTFKEQYGWAAKHLGIKKPNFADIEHAVTSDHLRPYYRMASHNVHANAKGIYFKLGLLDESRFLLAGPSNIGLADPGNSAAFSLWEVSWTLVLLSPTLDNVVALEILRKLEDDVKRTFLDVHEQFKEQK